VTAVREALRQHEGGDGRPGENDVLQIRSEGLA
jgi:hypothetical protein